MPMLILAPSFEVFVLICALWNPKDSSISEKKVKAAADYEFRYVPVQEIFCVLLLSLILFVSV